MKDHRAADEFAFGKQPRLTFVGQTANYMVHQGIKFPFLTNHEVVRL